MLIRYNGISPDVEKALFVAPNATIIGKVTLGKDSSVWYGAVIRGDLEPIRIGEKSNVQDNAVLHCSHNRPMNIGNNVTIGHGAVVHGCTIEDNVLVGMGCTLLNGCVIGAGSIVAAGAVVPEGMIVPPGSMVMGVPARIKGTLKGEHIDMPLKGAEEYRQLAEQHLSATQL